MKNNAYSKDIKKRSIRLESLKQGKMIRRFYIKFLHMLSRKTEAEKRIQLYGKDPFK